MRSRWLHLLVKLTYRIYDIKEQIFKQEGFNIIPLLFRLMVLEGAYFLVAFPLYFITTQKHFFSFIEKKGKYKKIASDFRVRQVLTLTGVGIILILWIVKYLVVAWTPQVTGQVSLYTMTDLVAVSMDDSEIFGDGVQPESNIDESLSVPKITKATKEPQGNYIFSGTGIPGASIHLFLNEEKSIVYRETVRDDGTWQVRHSQSDLTLQEGKHSLFAYHYIGDTNTRSTLSQVQYFDVVEEPVEKALRNADSYMNTIIIAIIIGGGFLLFLTI